MSIRDEIRFNREIQRLVGNDNKFLQVNKRNIRALLKRKDDENTRIFHDTGDGGYIKRMVLPDDIQTIDDAVSVPSRGAIVLNYDREVPCQIPILAGFGADPRRSFLHPTGCKILRAEARERRKCLVDHPRACRWDHRDQAVFQH